MSLYRVIKDVFSVAELRKRLAEAEAVHIKLTEEHAKLRDELANLQKQIQPQLEMRYQDNVYWRQIIESRTEGPFCPKCFDGNHKSIKMSDYSNWHAWICPTCQCTIRKPGEDIQTA